VVLDFPCGREVLSLRLPDDALVLRSSFPAPVADPEAAVRTAAERPVDGPPLAEALRRRRPGRVVLAVPDITRPVGFPSFLPGLLDDIARAGVPADDVTILIATGQHRRSTPEERLEMFGPRVVGRARILDHDGADGARLALLPGRSWSGRPMRVNRDFRDAGFRLIVGLVEPHFMAGFSGGRKMICPGLSCLETLRRFHGVEFIGHPRARNGCLRGNPLHEEALSVARAVGVDFNLNVVQDGDRRLVAAYAGGLEPSHLAACEFVRRGACPAVDGAADAVVTSCGGYPLDATFYQCVKAFASALPAVRRGGAVIACGGTAEGVGGREYAAAMREYAGRWRAYAARLRGGADFVKDQWQIQKHVEALEHLGEGGMGFASTGLPRAALEGLWVTPLAGAGEAAAEALQREIDRLAAGGTRLVAIPEGPYCAPVPAAGAEDSR
jgi:nickel-dependent lactate racemase